MIEFKGITKQIGDKVILNDINLHIKDGDLVVLIGPSGCGKTTTLKMINKLIKPTEGSIFINGNLIAREDTIQLRRQIGYVIQNVGLFPHMTIKENIELIPKLKKEPLEKINKKTIELLNMVGLNSDEYMNKYPAELSGGQQQRVAIARALIAKPDIIFADEPTGNLDSKSGSEVMNLLIKTSKQFGKTLVVITHDDRIAKLADRKISIIDGVLMEVK